MLIGCALGFARANLCNLTYIFIIIILIFFPPLKKDACLHYIDNVGVEMFVVVPIELLVFVRTFRSTV